MIFLTFIALALDTKMLNDDNLKKYKMDVEETNSMITEKFEEYSILLENMVKSDQGRIDFIRGLINESLKYTTKMANVFVDKSQMITNVTNYINGENDMKLYINSAHKPGLNPLFVPLEFTVYVPKYCFFLYR